MYTLSCRNKHIQAIQCLHGQLGDTLATALATGRGDTSCLVKRVNIIRAYLRILYCHWVPTKKMNYLYSINIIDGVYPPPLTSITQTTTEGIQAYSKRNTLPLGIINILIDIAGTLDDDSTIEWEIIGETLYVWSNSNQLDYSNINNLIVSDLSISTGDFLSKKNCLTDLQINNIITSSYKVLETESGCGCS